MIIILVSVLSIFIKAQQCSAVHSESEGILKHITPKHHVTGCCAQGVILAANALHHDFKNSKGILSFIRIRNHPKMV